MGKAEPLTRRISFNVSASIGKVSGLVMDPEHAAAVLPLAHGAGAGMTHPFMEALAQQLVQKNIATVRFNFPFTENKKGRPDPPAVAEKTIQQALEKTHDLFPNLPLFASGKSFGGRMSSQRLSKECPPFVKGIVFFGFPLHAPGKASSERAAHLTAVKVPMLFLQGTRDALATWNLMEEVCSQLPAATLCKLEGADHSFKSGKKEFIPELADQTAQWVSLQI